MLTVPDNHSFHAATVNNPLLTALTRHFYFQQLPHTVSLLVLAFLVLTLSCSTQHSGSIATLYLK